MAFRSLTILTEKQMSDEFVSLLQFVIVGDVDRNQRELNQDALQIVSTRLLHARPVKPSEPVLLYLKQIQFHSTFYVFFLCHNARSVSPLQPLVRPGLASLDFAPQNCEWSRYLLEKYRHNYG